MGPTNTGNGDSGVESDGRPADADLRAIPGDPYWEDGGEMPVGPDLVESGYGEGRSLPGLTYDWIAGRDWTLAPSTWTVATALLYAGVLSGAAMWLGLIRIGGRSFSRLGIAILLIGAIGLYLVRYFEGDSDRGSGRRAANADKASRAARADRKHGAADADRKDRAAPPVAEDGATGRD